MQKLRDRELVDYRAVAKLKRKVLESLYRNQKIELPTQGLRDFAVFEALKEELGPDWRRWPGQYRSPRSTAVRNFASKYQSRVGVHAWVQSVAREQLDGVQRRALELGMPVGLYVDLALG